MAQETVGITIRINGQDKVLSSIGEIKKELKFAEDQAKFFATQGEKGAAQFQNYAQVVKQLKEQVEDSTKAVQQFSGEGKLDAVIGSVRGIAGAFTAVQGALGAVGVQGEAVQNTLLKVQSALAISEGLKSLQEGIKSFKDLGKVIASTSVVQRTYNFVMFGTATATRAADAATKATSISMRILRGVMASLGIGLLITGVTLLIQKIIDWTSSTEDNKRAQERLNSALEAQEKLFSQQKESLARQREVAVLRAQLAGKSADEIFNINQNYNKKDRQAAVDNFNQIKADLKRFEKEKLKVRADGNLEGNAEDIKAYNTAKEALAKAYKEIGDIDFNNQKDQLQNKIRVNQDNLKKDQEASSKSKAQREKDAEERRQAEEDANKKLRDLQDENFANSIKDETQKALVKLSQQKERDIIDVQQSKANAETKAKLIAQIEEQFRIEKENIETEAANKKKEKELADQKELADRNAKSLEDRNQRIREQFEYEKKLREEYYQADLEATKFLQDEKVKAVETGLNILNSLAGRNEAIGNIIFTIQKAIEIGRIITSTTGAIAKIKADTAAIPAFVGPGIPNPAFAAALAVGAKKIIGLKIGAASSIASLVASSLSKFKGGGGGASGAQQGDVGTISSSAPIAPPSPQAALTQLDQVTINRLGSASNRSYVLESDITNSQERITRINRAARLN